MLRPSPPERYAADELQQHSDAPEEWARLRGIFEEIRARALRNEGLTIQERRFFCFSTELLPGEINPENYSACDNYCYSWKYLRFQSHFSGKGKPVPKVRGGPRPSPTEYQQAVSELEQAAEDWRRIVLNDRHIDSFLQEAAIQIRKNLKGLRQQNPLFQKGYLMGGNQRRNYENALLLRSRWLYIAGLEIADKISGSDLSFEINGTPIEFTFASLYHILDRHYAVGALPYNMGKDAFGEIILPDQLHLHLRDFISKIDQSGLYRNQSINRIGFRYQGTIYLVRSQIHYRQVKGKGSVGSYHVETFHPVTRADEMDKIRNEYEEQEVDQTLSVFLKKPTHPTTT